MEYNFREIEQKWQDSWKERNAYKVPNTSSKPKFYVLDMFPYPSGAGLHVGHPLGYIASDIYSRYKRLKGYNVLHPMGYDAFGLPAEQYAIEHGVHPALSTNQNISNFRSQLDKIGFSYDWDREVRTCEPGYYKWTQWIFLQLFKSFYNRQTQKAEPIDALIKAFETEGSIRVEGQRMTVDPFTAEDWKSFSEKQQQDILMEYRLAFCGYGEVNWCEALGTVLANDEVVNGVSERGGYPVEKKKLRQWYLRITEYADRLLEGLNRIEFSESMKDMQANWIGKSYGAEVDFRIAPSPPAPPAEAGQVLPGEEKGAQVQQTDLIPGPSLQMEKGAPVQQTSVNQTGRGGNSDNAFENENLSNTQSEDIYASRIEGPLAYKPSAQMERGAPVQQTSVNQTGRGGNSDNAFENENLTKPQSENSYAARIGAPLALWGEGPGVRGLGRLKVYTTRPDTIFGVDFMVIAPEHELVAQITTPGQQQPVDEYVAYVKSRSERERQAEKKISGCFTGAYAINPFNGREIPVWISEYVLAGYGTGAIMAVPCGDERDFKFANHFGIPITNIIGDAFNGQEANPTKDAILHNSDFLNGLVMRDAIEVVNNKIGELGIGKKKTNYKMRDAAFSRQRYWGEPFPIIWKDGIAYPLDENELPLELPVVESYSPGPEGEGPLANIPEWTARQLETNTMPGYAGSSWYFLRYMDPHNNGTFCDRTVSDYWNQVDLYIGGTEHAVGHLLYSRLWTKVLFDLGHIGFDEPFKKLLNQGMIQGSSRLVLRLYTWGVDGEVPENTTSFPIFFSSDIIEKNYDIVMKQFCEIMDKRAGKSIFPEKLLFTFTLHYVDVTFVDGLELDISKFKEWKLENADAEFIYAEDGKFYCSGIVEKMSKSKFNTVNPNDLVEKYGADTFRMYEMFLGPVEQSKPWDTKGIEGVHRFLKKLWRLFYDEIKGLVVTDDAPNAAELKVLHKTIKKIEEDTERFSFNTAVSTFMIAVNELSDLKCHKRSILEALVILLVPYAPHIAEELYAALGNKSSVLDAAYPAFDPSLVLESTKEYPVSINGKVRTTMNILVDAEQAEVEQLVYANELVQKWVDGKPVKKFIYVKGRMINVVI
ncbi:hypothetical protein BH10BAC3_BH10BAC3_22450 [soil metagenome]